MKEFDPERNIELNDAPKLKSTGKHPFFKVPNRYFETFYQRLLKRMEAEQMSDEELMEEAPILSSIKKETFFEVPTDYFSDFDFSHKFVEADISAPQKAEGNIRSLRLPSYSFGIAAAVLLLLGLLWFLPQSQSSTDWEDIETEELLAMVEEEKIDEYVLAEVLGEEGLKKVDLSTVDLDIDLSREELSEMIEEEYDLFELENIPLSFERNATKAQRH